MIDITMATVIRPEIITKTLKSFTERMLTDRARYRLILNIDNIGEDFSPLHIVNIAKQYFDNIVYNVADTPNFCFAMKWLWEQVETDIVFNLEDDWYLHRFVDVDDMLRIMNENPKMVSLRLAKMDVPSKKEFHLFQAAWEYQSKNLFISRRPHAFGLNPALVRKKYIKEAIKHFECYKSPSRQLLILGRMLKKVTGLTKYGLYANPGDKALVDGWFSKDWVHKTGLARSGFAAPHFLFYVKRSEKRKKTRSWYISKFDKSIKMIMMHESKDLPIIASIFDSHNPKMVIELGTWNAGFTLFLHECNKNIPLHTFDRRRIPDIVKSTIPKIFNDNVIFHTINVYKSEDLINLLKNESRKLLYIDDGEKARSLVKFSQFIRDIDLIGVHDWLEEVSYKMIGVAKALEDFKEHDANELLKKNESKTRFFVRVR
jgi:hypothetical protein